MKKIVISGLIGLGLLLGMSGCSEPTTPNLPMANLPTKNIVLSGTSQQKFNISNGKLNINGQSFFDKDGNIVKAFLYQNKIYYFVTDSNLFNLKNVNFIELKYIENGKSNFIHKFIKPKNISYTIHNGKLYLDVKNKAGDILYEYTNNQLQVVDRNVNWDNWSIRDNWKIDNWIEGKTGLERFKICVLFGKDECWQNYNSKIDRKDFHYIVSNKYLNNPYTILGIPSSPMKIYGAIGDNIFIKYGQTMSSNAFAVFNSKTQKTKDLFVIAHKQIPFIIYRSGNDFVLEINNKQNKKYLWLNKLEWIKGINKNNFKRARNPFGIGGKFFNGVITF